MDSVSLNAVFLNFVALISVVEAGLLTAAMFRLYEPLASQDWPSVRQWVRSTGRLYRVAAFGILLLGGLTAMVVPWVVRDLGLSPSYVIALYLLAVCNAAALCVHAEKKALLIAGQRNYQVVGLQVAALTVQTILQVVLLHQTGSFAWFLVAQLIGTLTWNCACSLLARRRYRILACSDSDDREKTKILFGDLKNLFLYKMGAVGLSATDAIFVSIMVSSPAAGLLSNFTLIVNAVNTVLMQAFNGIAASIGLHNVSASQLARRRTFVILSSFGNWIFGVACVILYVALDPFVVWWLGSQYSIDAASRAALVFTLFIIGSNQIASLYRSSLGIFRATRFVPFVALILNVVFSVVLGLFWGMPGVLLATGLARACTYSIVDPVLVFRRSLGSSSLRYYLGVGTYFLAVVAGSLVSTYIAGLAGVSGFAGVVTSLAVGSASGIVFLTPILFCSQAVRARLRRLLTFW